MRPCPRSISRAIHARAVVSMLVLGMTLAASANFALVAQRVDVLGNRPAPWEPAGSNILAWISSPSNFGITNAAPVALVPDGSGGAVRALVSASMAVEPHSNFNLHRVQPNGSITGFPFFTGDFSGGPSPLQTAP
jgi:hypothetical protein